MRYGAPVGCRIEVHDQLPRCMDLLREQVAAVGPEQPPLAGGTVILAGKLTGGNGRFDREWFAPPGGVWLALAWADTLLPEYGRLLPLAVGSACCQAVRSCGVEAHVKWVNDIHVAGRKIGGILCETFTGGAAADRYHLIGIGINANNIDFPPDLQATATSMHAVLGRPVDLDGFARRLLAFLSYHLGLVHYCEELELRRGPDERGARQENLVVGTWRRFSDTLGRRVMYGYDVVRDPRYRAVAVDIDSSGALVLQPADGCRLVENSGEILYLDSP